MSCNEIIENANYQTELLSGIKQQLARYFILVVLLSTVCGMLILYIFYDRHMDSLAEVEATTTEVNQDGNGINTYTEEGDVIFGSDSKENSKKTEGQQGK